MTAAELKKTILAGGIDAALTEGLSVSPEAVPAQRERYARATDAFLAKYGDGDLSLYSVGGRPKSPATTPTTTTDGSSRPP